MKIRIGYGLGTQGLLGDDESFATLVDELERLRFDSLWLSERVAGSMPSPLIALAFAAGRTQRLKLGTSVLVVPGRNPVLLAKELATLDRLSGGRLLPAVGLGVANPVEQQAFGVERSERAGWFEEAVPLLRRIWTEECVDHFGQRFTYRALSVGPRPVQAPIDVWLGGRAPSELRRVGRLGDGWLASFCTPDEAASGKGLVEEAAAQAQREIDPEHFGVIVRYARGAIPASIARQVAARRPGLRPEAIVPSGLDALCARVEQFVQVGFSKFVLVPAEEPADWDAELEQVAEVVLPLGT
jgi:probable F420-dependent oxidoreductase